MATIPLIPQISGTIVSDASWEKMTIEVSLWKTARMAGSQKKLLIVLEEKKKEVVSVSLLKNENISLVKMSMTVLMESHKMAAMVTC